MRYALVIIEPVRLDDRQAQIAVGNASRTAIDKTAKSGKVVPLNEGCFLCDLSSGLLDLGNIVAAASQYGLQSRTLLFEKEPQFVISLPTKP